MDDQSPGSNEAQPPHLVTFDAIMPATMAVRAAQMGVTKASTDPLTVLVLAILAGAFIAFGAIFATTVSAGGITIASTEGGAAFSTGLPFGVVRLLTGIVFSVGIMLVVVGGAELFTGNNLIVMAWASGRVKTRDLLLNWAVAFVGNFIGAIGTAALVFISTQYTFGAGAVGLMALTNANAKASLAFVPAVILGIMCNALVCLAVWMCYGARTTIDRVVTVVPPIAAFVAAGFEHCIANIYFIPMGLFIKAGAPDSFWASIGKTAVDFSALTWSPPFIG
jgi:formate/nitrite transporter